MGSGSVSVRGVRARASLAGMQIQLLILMHLQTTWHMPLLALYTWVALAVTLSHLRSAFDPIASSLNFFHFKSIPAKQ